MKDSIYNAIILYLIIIVGIVFIKPTIFFRSGYELTSSNYAPLPNFVIATIILAFFSLYMGRTYT